MKIYTETEDNPSQNTHLSVFFINFKNIKYLYPAEDKNINYPYK